MEIIETPVFSRKISKILSDDEYSKLQRELVANPGAGTIIPGCQGLRKLRWNTPGGGKRGGLRIIYYWYITEEKLYMLFAFKKSERVDLTKDQKKILIAWVKEGVI